MAANQISLVPGEYRRATRSLFCVPLPVADQPLKVSREAAPALLALPMYKGVDTAALIKQANLRLHHAERNMMRVSDRPTAIAVLEGVRIR